MTGEGGLRPEGGKIPGIVDVDVQAFRPPTISIPSIFYRENSRDALSSASMLSSTIGRRLLRNFHPNSTIRTIE